MLPDETPEDVRMEIEALLASLRGQDPRFQASFDVTLSRPGLEVGRDVPIARALHDALIRCAGIEPQYIGQGPWYDAALLAQAGVPTVIFGPSGGGAHAAVEYVDVASVVTCAQVLAQTIVDFCGVDTVPT